MRNFHGDNNILNIDSLKIKRQSLINSSNSEWNEILNLREHVKSEFKNCGFLTVCTFNAVVEWKLRQQKKRTDKHRVGNSAKLISELTGVFWRVEHEDKDKLLFIHLNVLMAIPGIGIGVASAIMTLSHPAEYAIIDFRNWNVLYGENKRQFTHYEYKKYLNHMRELSRKLRCDVQEIDYVLWKQY